MEQVLFDYLKLLNIPISKNYFRKQVASHPEYPSILSVADTLERLGIEHAVARIQQEDLENLLFPFVLHLNRGQGQLLLIRNQRELEKYRSDIEDWDGVVLVVEKNEITLDKEHRESLSREKMANTGGVLLGLSSILFFWNNAIPAFYMVLFVAACHISCRHGTWDFVNGKRCWNPI
jgi:hypothetical protein